MIESQATLAYHVEKFYNEQTLPRKANIAKRIAEVEKIVNTVLKGVEATEPRFVSTLSESDSRLEGLEVISPNEFEVILFLNQMGVYNFVDDGNHPGCASLRLIDGRKRSMSLWVEFVTASQYLSARKIRARFQSLVTQVLEKLNMGVTVCIDLNSSEVQLIIRGSIVVRIVPTFRCYGLWPETMIRWPTACHTTWPPSRLIEQVRNGGINLVSKELDKSVEKPNSIEDSLWTLSFTEAENKLIGNECRKKCLSILKTLRDRHLDYPGSPLNNYHMKTLLLYECDKHQHEMEWKDAVLGDRIQGILLQLVSCLRCRKLPHYFVPTVDLFRNNSPSMLDLTIKHVWHLTREIITNSKNFDNL